MPPSFSLCMEHSTSPAWPGVETHGRASQEVSAARDGAKDDATMYTGTRLGQYTWTGGAARLSSSAEQLRGRPSALTGTDH